MVVLVVDKGMDFKQNFPALARQEKGGE